MLAKERKFSFYSASTNFCLCDNIVHFQTAILSAILSAKLAHNRHYKLLSISEFQTAILSAILSAAIYQSAICQL